MNASQFSFDGDLDGLTPAQQDRLAAVLDECLQKWERGEALNRSQLRREHPDLADHLDEYLAGLDYLHDAVGDLHPGASFAEPLSPGSRVSDFVIVREVGRGGMGVVYEARQESLNRQVALKVLPHASLLSRKQTARFRNEAAAAAQLDHPHIAHVYAHGCENGLQYIAMRLIAGKNLDEKITEWKGDSPADQNRSQRFRLVARWIAQAADALHAAHDLGVVHRDVKPSNLMVDSDGQIWMMDFGLARYRNEVELTQSGDFVGTMRYMSPEQAQGKTRMLDARSDVYSLGATLYELLTLRHAVRGDDPAAILRQLERDRPYSLRSFQSAIPVDLETIALKALAHDPDDRYASAAELRDDLNRFLHNRPIEARRPSLIERAWKGVQRRKRLTAAITLASITLAAILCVAVLVLWQKDQEAKVALAQAETNQQRYELQLAVNHNQLALLHDRSGDPDRAIEMWRTSIGHYESLMQSELSDLMRSREWTDVRRGHATACGNLSWALAERDLPQAIRWNDAARTSLAALAKHQMDASTVTDLALQYGNLGVLKRRIGDPAGAVESFAKAIVFYQKLPTKNQAAQASQIAVNLNNLALAYQDLGERGQGVRALDQALDHLSRSNEPTHHKASLVGAIHGNRAAMLQRDGRWTEAFSSYRQAIQQQRKALTARPDSRKYSAMLDKLLAGYAKALADASRWDDAAGALLQREPLCAGDPQRLLGLARKLLAIADETTAARWREESVRLVRQALELDARLTIDEPLRDLLHDHDVAASTVEHDDATKLTP